MTLFINIELGLNAINSFHSAMVISHDVVTSSVNANHKSKCQTDLLFVRHPLPGFELGLPRPQPNSLDKLDRSAMGLQ